MYIRVHVNANAKRESLEQVSETSFNISVKEKAEQNLANRRVLEVLAMFLKFPVQKLRIISGHHSPSKIVSVHTEAL